MKYQKLIATVSALMLGAGLYFGLNPVGLGSKVNKSAVVDKSERYMWFSEQVDRFNSRVPEAISELRPYFGVSEEKLESFELPNVIMGILWTSYTPTTNILEISHGDSKSPDVLGEEVGHWYHYQLNPGLFEKEKSFKKSYDLEGSRKIISLIEYVGKYAGLVLADSRNYILDEEICFMPDERNDIYFQQSQAHLDFIMYGPDLLKKIVHAQSLEEVEKIKRQASHLSVF